MVVPVVRPRRRHLHRRARPASRTGASASAATSTARRCASAIASSASRSTARSIVLAASKEYKLLARNELGEPVTATPAVADGRHADSHRAVADLPGGQAMTADAADRRRCEALDRPALEAAAARAAQRPARRRSCRAIRSTRPSCRTARGGSSRSTQLAELPLTTKDELAEAGAAGDAARFPVSEYVRFHQTSGTHGRPLPVLDTAADWQWWIDCWQFVLDAAEVTADDRRDARVFVRPVHRLLDGARCARRPRRAGDSQRRDELARPARADGAHRRHRAVLHAELRAAAGRSGGRAQDRPAQLRRAADHRRRRAGRLAARRAAAHRRGVAAPR